MAVSAHVETLQQKHTTLESLIAQELRRPNPDQTRLAELKKQKLHIKDTLSGFSAKAD